jgi:hypothetical protein
MFKIQFRVDKYYSRLMCCKIIFPLTLWNIEENKYININITQIYSENYTKYKNIFNHYINPVNYSGKILSNYNNEYILISLLNGKVHGNKYFFENKQLFTIYKYYMGKLNTVITFNNKIDGYYSVCCNIGNLSSQRAFEFNKDCKLLSFSNDLRDIKFVFYLNGKIKTYSNSEYKQFKFTKNGVIKTNDNKNLN